MKKKKIIYILALILISICGYAQQNAQYNQYIFNELIINPAYAGTKGMLNANAIYSKQWTGFDGSPTTQTLSIEGPVSIEKLMKGKTEKISLGLHLINDRIGSQSQQGFFGSYAYKLLLPGNFKLSMGLSLGASYFSLDGAELTTAYPDDPVVPKTMVRKLRLDSKTGVFLYSDRLYAGFSVSDLLAKAFHKNEDLLITQVSHYYLTSGYIFDIIPKFKLKPSVLVKCVSKSPTNIDLSSYILYNDKFWLGASLRFGSKVFNKNLENSLRERDALILMMEYNINEKYRIGYAYTMTTTVLKNYAGHEIMLGYYFPEKIAIKKMEHIRYF